jgi:heat shock protein HslJ
MVKTTTNCRSIVVLFLLTALALLSLTVGCGEDPFKEGQSHLGLHHRWQLEAFITEGATTISVDDPTKYTISLIYYDTTTLRSDCNSCEGRYFHDDSSLRFSELACTQASCGPESFDPQFRAAVSTVFAYEVRDEQRNDKGTYGGGPTLSIPSGPLFLMYDGGVMRLTKAPSDD